MGYPGHEGLASVLGDLGVFALVFGEPGARGSGFCTWSGVMGGAEGLGSVLGDLGSAFGHLGYWGHEGVASVLGDIRV